MTNNPESVYIPDMDAIVYIGTVPPLLWHWLVERDGVVPDPPHRNGGYKVISENTVSQMYQAILEAMQD